ncbi:MAG: hypothetical protein LBJ00_10860 [Planctomycetaceae bacterium]|jgi:hypothetical protein|nr:hypothetical protein [Planctomycetaceae bacterium]
MEGKRIEARVEVVFQIVDRWSKKQTNTTDEKAAWNALQNGDFVTMNEITKSILFTGQEVTTIIATKFFKERG